MTQVIPRESKRITYSSEIRALKLVPFTAEQLSIVKGSLLGDGCLHAAWPGTSKNYVFSKMHSVKQREYVEWVHQKMQPFMRQPPRLYEPTQSLRLRTIGHAELTELMSKFYRDGKKILPPDISDIVADPLALAVWFMDDGNASNSYNITHGYNINTQSFTEEEQRKIVTAFAERLHIECNLQMNNGKYRIYIGTKFMEPFFMTIYEYVLPSMQYKLGTICDSLRTRRD